VHSQRAQPPAAAAAAAAAVDRQSDPCRHCNTELALPTLCASLPVRGTAVYSVRMSSRAVTERWRSTQLLSRDVTLQGACAAVARAHIPVTDHSRSTAAAYKLRGSSSSSRVVKHLKMTRSSLLTANCRGQVLGQRRQKTCGIESCSDSRANAERCCISRAAFRSEHLFV
jgi:hypothetical protein